MVSNDDTLKNEKMKKVFLAVFVFLSLVPFAQEKEGHRAEKVTLTSEQKVDLQVKKITKELLLNEKQSELVKALVVNQLEKREKHKAELKAMNDKNRVELKTQIEREQAAMNTDMKKILTIEQYNTWEKNRDERKEKMKQKMKQRMQDRMEERK